MISCDFTFQQLMSHTSRALRGIVRTRVCIAGLFLLASVRYLAADPTTFTLDASHSSLKVTGTVATPIGPTQFKRQVTGSDTSSYSGFILANLSAGEIEFPGMSSVSANNFVGPALTPDNPADYGLKATVIFSTANATVINLVFDLTSGPLAVALNGTFPANTSAMAAVTSGTIDYTAPAPIGNGSKSLAGSTAMNQSTTSATIAILGSTQTLTIPIIATIPFTVTNPNDSTATFTGQLVATRPFVAPTSAYWHGDLDANWATIEPTAATNWRTDAAGAMETLALPGAATDVFFTTSDHGANLATSLGANLSIKGLTLTADATSPVSIGAGNTLTLGADGLTAQSGAAAATINCPVVLATSQTWSNDSANSITVNGNISLGSSTLTKSGSGIVVLTGSQTFGNNAAVVVTADTLRFQSTASAASIGAGVLVTVDGGAQLELADSGSALSDGVHFAKIANDSQLAAGGLLVSGTNQRVGSIVGAGATVIASGASLIANSIRQNALEIGGTAGSNSLVTIAASDATGNPLGGSPLNASVAAGSIPEPSGLVLAAIAATLIGGLRCVRRTHRRTAPNRES